MNTMAGYNPVCQNGALFPAKIQKPAEDLYFYPLFSYFCFKLSNNELLFARLSLLYVRITRLLSKSVRFVPAYFSYRRNAVLEQTELLLRRPVPEFKHDLLTVAVSDFSAVLRAVEHLNLIKMQYSHCNSSLGQSWLWWSLWTKISRLWRRFRTEKKR